MFLRNPARCLLPGLLFALGACGEPQPHQALGTLEYDRVTLTATVAELIVDQPVPEGSAVTAGQLLVQLDTRLQDQVIARLDAELLQHEALLTELRNGPRREEIAAAQARTEAARAGLEEAEQDLARVTALLERGHGTRAEQDTLRSRRNSAAARLRDAEAQLALLQAGTRTEALTQAEARRQALQAQLALERERLRDHAIRATRDGRLDSLPWHVGQRVTAGQPVAVMLTAGAPHARVYLPESVRAQLQTGMPLQVQVDGIAAPFEGTVRWIASEPAFTPYYALNESERSRLVWLAEVQLPDSAAELPAGLPAQVLLP